MAAPPSNAAAQPPPPSAQEFAQRLSELAHAAAGKPAPPPPSQQQQSVPLVPIYIGIDRVERGEEQQWREAFLYRLGDPKWSVKSAASRLVLETNLPGGSCEKTVQDQISMGLKPYADWSRPAQPQLVELQFYVRLGDRVFRDEVLWDVSNPNNAAEPYAVHACADLGLGADWFDAIRAHVQQQLQDVMQDLREAPQHVQLQPPPSSLQRANTQPRRGPPRLEPYDAASDAEAARVAARQQRQQPQAPGQQPQPQ